MQRHRCKSVAQGVLVVSAGKLPCICKHMWFGKQSCFRVCGRCGALEPLVEFDSMTGLVLETHPTRQSMDCLMPLIRQMQC
jgi:hypothetical protein